MSENKLFSKLQSENEGLKRSLEHKDARIAALELALKKLVELGDRCNDDSQEQEFARKALSSSKLGELFQALLEEHKESKGFYIQNLPQFTWNKVEALRKEVGI